MRLRNLQKKDGNEPLIIKFSPWNYSNKSDLIYTFLKNLGNELGIQADEETKKYKIGKFLSDYAEAFSVVKFIPFVGTIIEPVAKTAIKVQGENLTQVPDLEGTKDKLVRELKDLKNKIIVVIDDIDRLTSSQIRDIFQLVKQVADFPNIVYVLVMDKEVVCSALEKVHNMDGNEYLEKIIQIPFELPEIRKGSLHNILRDRINKIINGPVSNEEYYASIFRKCVEPYVNTMRDVNRLINVFQFKYEALNRETLPED